MKTYPQLLVCFLVLSFLLSTESNTAVAQQTYLQGLWLRTGKNPSVPVAEVQKINLDLNKRAGGQYIYLFKKRGRYPSAWKPLAELKVIEGKNANPGPNWNKFDLDLNRGAGGAHLWLCYRYAKPGEQVITDTHVIEVPAANQLQARTPPGWKNVAVDLNKGAGGSYLYLIYKSGFIPKATSFQGRLLNSDPYDIVRKTSHRKVHTVPLQRGKKYTLSLSSSVFRPYIRLEDASGNPLAADGGNRWDSVLKFSPPESGEYNVIVTSTLKGTGNYGLWIYPPVPARAKNIHGLLTIANQSTEGKYYFTHKVALEKGTNYTFDLTSSRFDTYLKLLDSQGKLLRHDDDGGDDLNSRITFTPSAGGTYRLVVTSYAKNAVGNYALAISPPPGSSAGLQDKVTTSGDKSPLANNQAYSGELSRSANKKDGRYYDLHVVTLKADTPYNIRLRTSAFPPIIQMEDFQGNLIRKGDDNIIFRAPEAGVYRLLAMSDSSRKTGNYQLSISPPAERKTPAPPPSRFRFPDHYTLIKPNDPILDAVGDQGNEGACVAWATCGVIGTTVMRDWYTVNTGNPAKIESFMDHGANLLDAKWFYRQRGFAGPGWWTDKALLKATKVTIPFKYGNTGFGIRLTKGGYKAIFDKDEMREVISLDRPLVAEFTVYSDFQKYFQKGKNVYLGPKPGNKIIGYHAVMVVGYNKPSPGKLGIRSWDCQNSWGKQWGNKGHFKMGENVANLDNVMYAVYNWYMCDRKGKIVTNLDEQNRIMNQVIAAIPK